MGNDRLVCSPTAGALEPSSLIDPLSNQELTVSGASTVLPSDILVLSWLHSLGLPESRTPLKPFSDKRFGCWDIRAQVPPIFRQKAWYSRDFLCAFVLVPNKLPVVFQASIGHIAGVCTVEGLERKNNVAPIAEVSKANPLPMGGTAMHQDDGVPN